MAHDLVIRNGLVVDGTGAEPFPADLAVDGDTITAIGAVGSRGREEIDAQGHAVTPGFVDLHTHLDAQVGWDPDLTPVSWHGVTTALFGNCGVTFAPVRPSDHEFLAGMMETVEDIPRKAILHGLPWNWESYAEYLNSVAAMNPAINIAGLVGHCAVRFYVMGERSVEEPATDEDIAEMKKVVEQSMKDGAVGFSTSRFLGHFLPDGRHVPGTHAEDKELIEIARTVGEQGGMMQAAIDFSSIDREMNLLKEEARVNTRILFSVAGGGTHEQGDLFESKVREFQAEGLDITGVTVPRSGGGVWGLSTGNFWRTREWHALAEMSLAERLAAIEDPVRVKALVASVDSDPALMRLCRRIYWLGDGEQPNYTRERNDNLATLASEAGEHPVETFIRMARESGGQALFHARGFSVNLDALENMIRSDWVLPGLGDAGAHVGQIVDAGWATFTLSHWHRDRQIWDLAETIRRLTSAPAQVLGLNDRGRLAAGRRADINVIDVDRVAERMPQTVADFPFGASRLIQRAVGYRATICNGGVILRDDELTGTRAGRVIR
jgi:N-acyl-D-aspartate/D-glutamate deacylase